MVETVLNTVAWWQPEIGALAVLGFGAYCIAAGCACVQLLIDES